MKTFWHLKQSTSMMLMFIRVCLHTLFIVPILSMSSLSSFWPSTSRENSSTFPIPIGMLFEAYYGCKYFSWFGICLYTLILIFVLFSIHVCVCVFFFFFSWSNNLYLKGNKNLSWFGNFTSGKNYSTILTSKLLELNGKKHKYKTDTATKFQYTPLTQLSATSWRHPKCSARIWEWTIL